jgi:hypothetical protein
MKRTLLKFVMLALLSPVALTIAAYPAQAKNDIATYQEGKPKQPAPTPTPKPRKPGPRDEGDGD